MEHPDRAALEALALRWIGARLFEGERPLGEQGLPRAVPPELAALVAPGPARARTLDDAARWLGWPKPFGLGLACDLVNADAITLAAGGERALAPAHFSLSWVDRMDPRAQQVSRRDERFAALATVGGLWRVVALWDDADRHAADAQRALLAAAFPTPRRP